MLSAVVVALLGVALSLSGCGSTGTSTPAQVPGLSTIVTSPLGQKHVAGAAVDVFFHPNMSAGPRDDGWTVAKTNLSLPESETALELVQDGFAKGLYLVSYDFSRLNAATKQLFEKAGDTHKQLHPGGFFLGDKVFFVARVNDPQSERVTLKVTVGPTQASVAKGLSIVGKAGNTSAAAATSFFARRLSDSPDHIMPETASVEPQFWARPLDLAAAGDAGGELSTHVISKIGKDAIANISVDVYYSSSEKTGPRENGWKLVRNTSLSANGGNDAVVPSLQNGLYMIVYDFTKVGQRAKALEYKEDDSSFTALNPNGFFLGDKFSYVVKVSDAATDKIHLVLSVSDSEIAARPGVRSH